MSERQPFTVFYSWQSDLAGSANRSLIGDALERAAKTLRADDSIQVEAVIDRDTAGKAGSPDIAATILQKIEAADAFVADVSFKGIELAVCFRRVRREYDLPPRRRHAPAGRLPAGD